MENIISKEEMDKWMNIEGKMMGDTIITKAEFVLTKKGEHGLKQIEEALKKAGHPVDYLRLEKLKLYPVGLEIAILVGMKRIFGFTDEDFREMGRIEAKLAIIMRLFMRYFVSLERIAKEAPKIWERVYTIGNLKISELNKKEKYLKIKLTDFPLTPILCRAHEGWFAELIHVVINKPVSCREIKCTFKGDEYHEFKVEW